MLKNSTASPVQVANASEFLALNSSPQETLTCSSVSDGQKTEKTRLLADPLARRDANHIPLPSASTPNTPSFSHLTTFDQKKLLCKRALRSVSKKFSFM